MRRSTNRFIQSLRHRALLGLCSAVVGGFAGQGVEADCSNDVSFWAAMNQVLVEFINEQENSLVIAAWVASSPKQRKTGFQGVCRSLVIERSLLFSFPTPVHPDFHMIGVAVPLDIAFIDVSYHVIDIQRMTRQKSNEPIRYYRPKKEIQFALETAAGRLDQLRLNPGLWRIRISHRNQ